MPREIPGYSPDIASAQENKSIDPERKAAFFSNFLEENPSIEARLTEGGLLGSGSEGWLNLGGHNAFAGVIGREIIEAIGVQELRSSILNEDLDPKDVIFTAGTHDWNKRLQREKAQKGAIFKGGSLILNFDRNMENAQQASYEGLYKVTTDDVRGYENWGMAEMIVRYADSVLIPFTIKPEDKLGNAFARPTDRFKELAERYPDIDKNRGREIYGVGKLLYREIGRATKHCEDEIFAAISRNNPGLAKKYEDFPTTELKLYHLLQDRMSEKISKTPIPQSQANIDFQRSRIGDLIVLNPYDQNGRLIKN